MQLSAATIENLKTLAKRYTWLDNLPEGEYLDAQDCSGGNFDDAYAGGERAGETMLARTILEELGIDYK
jgi:hypothetical protein